MFFYNIIGPYYLQYNEIINQKQSSFVINVLLPFLFLPLFAPDLETRESMISSSILWGGLYLLLSFIFMDFSTDIISDRTLFIEESDGLIGSIMLSKYMAIIAIVSVIKLIASETRNKSSYVVISIFFILMILVAGQRGTLIGFVIAISCLIYRDEWRSNGIYIIISIVLLIAILTIYINFEKFEVINRFSEFSNFKKFNRYYDYFNVWNIFKDNDYFWGLGTNGYFFKVGRIYPHNIILEHISDYGLLGLMSIVILIVYCIRYSLLLIRYSGYVSDLTISCSWIVLCCSAMVSDSIIGHRLFYLFSGLLVLCYNDFSKRQLKL